MSFQPISHTADIGFEVKGKTLPELFSESAKALTGCLIEISGKNFTQILNIRLKADSPEELLVRWLEEILFLFETKSFVGLTFDVTVDQNQLQAVVKGREWEEEREFLKTQIKAVTFHGLEIKKTSQGYVARVILDV